MQRDLRPWVTTGVVLVGAGLIAVTPAATPLPDVQHRQIRTRRLRRVRRVPTGQRHRGQLARLGVHPRQQQLDDRPRHLARSQHPGERPVDRHREPGDQPDRPADRGRAAAHQQRRRVQRGLHRADGSHGQRRIGAQRQRLLHGAHRPRERAHYGPVRLPQRLPGNRWLRRADFPGVRAAHQHHRRRGHRPD